MTYFQKGKFYSHLNRACQINDGILQFSSTEKQKWEHFFNSKTLQNKSLTHFIPASGAASRLFKQLLKKEPSILQDFEKNLSSYPFYNRLCNLLKTKTPDF